MNLEHDSSQPNLIAQAMACLRETGVESKLLQTHRLAADYDSRTWIISHAEQVAPDDAGRPSAPVLVLPRDVPRRSLASEEGRGAFIHAIAHIEFNAVNLALDAIVRFPDLPHAYYKDWLFVADEEARHFELLRSRLQEVGFDYGDFGAHNGLWRAAQLTAHDPLVRMALVPRVLEARGLDVTPGMIERLKSFNDHQTVTILEIILAEEIGHVERGTRWFHYLCEQRGVEPDETYLALLQEYNMTDRQKKPLHHEARRAAGFSDAELKALEKLL